MKRTSETRVAQLMELLKDGKPRTAPMAADEMKADASAISAAMGCLMGRGQIHIADWTKRLRSGGRMIAVYQIGAGENKPMPAPPSKAEYRKHQSQREIEERERLAAERARPVVAFRHWQDVAFFGEHRRAA